MKSHDRTQKRSEDASTCPNCGRQITGIATRGPADHTASPCGCSLGSITARTLNRDDGLRADGSGEPVVTTETPDADDATNMTAVYAHRESTGSAVSDFIFVSFAGQSAQGLNVPSKKPVEEWVETHVMQQFDGEDGEERLNDLLPTEAERTGAPPMVGKLYFNRVTNEVVALSLNADAFDDTATDDGDADGEEVSA